MYRLLKPLLFTLNPESAHHLTFRMLRLPGAAGLLRLFASKDHPSLSKRVFGLEFRNPVGLAAGLDKDAIAFNELGSLGFGFIEIGTVTPKAQPGNEKPRLFRLPADEALINRMGFNNNGAEAAARKLANRKDHRVIIGGNIGKNKVTPNDAATADYLSCLRTLYNVVDYFVVNVSSPNTPNLRELQEKEPLTRLLKALQEENRKLGIPKPMLLKIAPDLGNTQLDEIIEIVKHTGLAGIIATNTTVDRAGLSADPKKLASIGPGGLSGKPLKKRSTEVIRYLRQNGGKDLAIIGVGGIHTADDAIEKLEAGADLIQLYTGFIYHGPGLIADIKKEILRRKK